MPRIALDARTVFSPRPRGTGKNLEDAYRHLAGLRPDWDFVLYHRGPRRDDPFAALPNVSTRRIDMRGDRWDLWQHLRLPLAAASDGVDLLHCPANSCPRRSVVPLVSTVHDLIPLKLPDPDSDGPAERFEAGVRRCLRRSRRVMAVSETTRRDLISDLGADAARVDVISWAPMSTYQPVRDGALLAAVRARYNLRGRYFLAITGCSRRKNARGMVRGYAALDSDIRDQVQFLLAGIEPPSRLVELRGLIAELGLEGSCQCCGFVPESDMPALLSGAEALAFCSLYEGFGLPVLDAFRCETAVLTSRSGSIPEVAGDAALYCDPLDPVDIAAGMSRLARDAGLRGDLVGRGLRRVAGFTWERTARQISDVFERCLNE